MKKTRLYEQYQLFRYRVVEFFSYTVCGIGFYRNYERFYWRNKFINEVLNKHK